VPAKADLEEQAAFLKDELAPRLEEAKRGERSVLFVDAAHFVYGPCLGCLWCLVRLFVPGPSGRKRYNVLGAIDAVTRRMIRVTNHAYINTSSVCDLLKAVSRAGLVGPVTLVLDNAAYQRCAFVQAYAAFLGVELLYLPPYSPNLNLIERVWRFVKKEVLAARVKEDYGAFTRAIDDCLDGLHTRHASQTATLLTLKFQVFDDVPVLAA
jgi:transposase